MNEDMELIQSDKINEVALAMVNVQAQMGIALNDAKNPYFNSKYSTLQAHWDAARGILAVNDLSFVQFPIGDGEKFGVLNMVLHSSGQYMGAKCVVRPVKSAPQELVSLLTYLRRTSMSGILSIMSGDDDDGNAATHGKGKEMSVNELKQFAEEAGPMLRNGMNITQVYAELVEKYSGLSITTVASLKTEIDNEQRKSE